MRPPLRRAALARTRRYADRIGAEVATELDAGAPAPRAREAYAARLTVADQQLAMGLPLEAAASFDSAMRTAFHRVLHFDGVSSPLADDPEGYLAPLAASTTAQAIRAPRGRDGRPAEGHQHLLLCTWRNANFIGPIRQHFEARPDIETRYQEFGGNPRLKGFVDRIAEQTLTGSTDLRDVAERTFRPELDWADVVFVDWCNALPALLTQVDPRGTRVIVRLHSFETFTRWPHLVDFSRVDDVVFVSEHVRDLTLAAVPALSGAGAPDTHVIANAMDLRDHPRPKPASARFTLGLVGASTLVKDPRWAIEVLRLLRATDDRYTLRLIGNEFSRNDSAATLAYAADLDRDLAELGPAVIDAGFTDDVPGALTQVGTILSSSIRESFHIGLAEGAASGAVPVVRDWPFFPGAAGRLFGEDWVVTTPQEAADRILALTADDRTWREAGAAASERMIERYDWQRVRDDYDRLIDGVPVSPS